MDGWFTLTRRRRRRKTEDGRRGGDGGRRKGVEEDRGRKKGVRGVEEVLDGGRREGGEDVEGMVDGGRRKRRWRRMETRRLALPPPPPPYSINPEEAALDCTRAAFSPPPCSQRYRAQRKTAFIDPIWNEAKKTYPKS